MQIRLDMTDGHQQHLGIARGLNIFYDSELRILARVLEDYEQARDGYVLLEERQGPDLVGFIICGRVPLTTAGWDIYWLVVDKPRQGRGIGKRLLARAEAYILSQDASASIRVETSTRWEYAHARNLYVKFGYQEAGRIADFYAPGDDIVIFYKKIAVPERSISPPGVPARPPDEPRFP